MRKMIWIALIMVFAKTASAQTAKDSLLNILAGEVCKSLSEKQPGSETAKEMEFRMANAFVPLLQTHGDAIAKFYDLETDTEGNGYKQLGIDVGMKMVSVCPNFMTGFIEKSSKDKDETTPSKKEKMSISGTLIKIIPGELTSISVRSTGGKTEKIWWMEYFEGADNLTQAMINKPISIQYYEKEVYNFTLKEYIKIKIAAGIK